MGYGAAVPLTGCVTQGKAPSLSEPGSLMCKRRLVYMFGPEWKLIFSGTLAAFDPASGHNHSAWHRLGAQKTLAE